MPLIVWDHSYSVGSPQLDADHQRFLDILGRVYDLWRQGQPDTVALNALFDELQSFTDEHFTREETALAAREYPVDLLLAHHEMHHDLKRRVVEFRTRHLSGQAPDRLTDEMIRFLKHWLLDHIMNEDMKYRPFFTQQRHA
ncbi:MAG: hemerythrin family protein [Alphaproteobacteria bacterium]|nr:hemerythrin family protein [Alphaproteobacteria bacterium]